MSCVFLISDVAEVAECGLSPVPPGLHRPGGPGCQRPRAHGHHHKGEVPPDPWLGADCLRGSFLKICFYSFVFELGGGGRGEGGGIWKLKDPEIMDIIMKKFRQTHGMVLIASEVVS